MVKSKINVYKVKVDPSQVTVTEKALITLVIKVLDNGKFSDEVFKGYIGELIKIIGVKEVKIV